MTVQRTILGQMQTQVECPACHGTGHVIDHPCETCDGQGRTPNHETVKIEVPAGIHSGQTLKVAGYGEAGVRGDRSGDLVVRIEVADSERFQRQGDDLFCVEDVSALEAMCGCAVEVDGVLEGEHVTVEVSAGTQHGAHIEAKGHGMPRQGTKARGSLFVVVNVVVPTDLTGEELDELRAMAAGRGERVADEGDGDGHPEHEDGHGGIFGRHPGRAASAKTHRGRGRQEK